MSFFFICCTKFLRSNSFCRNEYFCHSLTIHMHYKFNFSKAWIQIVIHEGVRQPFQYFIEYLKKSYVITKDRYLDGKTSSYFTQDLVYKFFLLTNKTTNTKYMLKTTKYRMYKNVMTQLHMSLPPQNLLVAKTCIISVI